MALSITVNGAGTFTASMEEGPVSFTASLGAVPGPKGDTGATGAAGVVAATAPITYNAGTQTVGISATPTFTSVTATTGNLTTVNLTTATFADATSQTTAFVGEARKVYVTGRNSTGSTIAKGKVVYLSGGTGNVPNIALALADSEATSARTIGITAEAIANNANGKVIISGACENIDTSAFSDGDTVYLSATTAGGLTTTLPAAPLHGVVIGIVTRANPSVGSIEVSINNYQELKELSDVSVSDRANNDGLFWESSSSTWRSKTMAEVLGYTPANGADYLAKADNLSGLASASTARTNLGLGTMAVETAANYALLASPALTGTPTAPTAAAATSTTQIATTAFVQQEVPAASTTAAGKVELATDAETRAGTSTSLVPTPFGIRSAIVDTNRLWLVPSQFTAATSGTGSSTSVNFNAINCQAPTTAVGYATRYYSMLFKSRGSAYNAPIDWSKRVEFNFILVRGSSPTDTNTVCRVVFGKTSFGGVAGDPSARAIGLRAAASGNYTILAHNGTSLTTSNTSTAFSSVPAQIRLVSDGAGNVELFVNGTSAGSTTGGPTNATTGSLNNAQLECENLATISGANMQAYIANMNAHFGE